MKHVVLFLAALLVALPAVAERKLELIVDVEGVRRSEIGQVTGGVRYQPDFDNGGGIGAGLNWWLSDRTSLEVKVAGLESQMHVRIVRSDAIIQGDLGSAQLFPLTAILQWHPLEGTGIQPYIGVGAAYILLRDIEGTSATPDVTFEDPMGLVLNAGLRVPLSKRWSFTGDARYIPVESSGSVRFGEGSDAARADIHVRPLVIGLGVAYHF